MVHHKNDENSSSPRADAIGKYRNPLQARLRKTFEEEHASFVAPYEPNFVDSIIRAHEAKPDLDPVVRRTIRGMGYRLLIQG